MSIEAMDWAKQQRCGSPSVKAVLMEIANWTNPEGRAEFRVVRDIARVVEMSERNVQRIISKLETRREDGGLGLLRRVPIYGESGVQRANGFVLVGFSGRVTSCHPAPRSRRKGEGDRLSSTGATDCHREGDTHVTGEGDAGVTPYQDHDLDKDNTPPTPQRGAERVQRPLPIAVDWVCPPIADLPAEIAALAAQWPKGAYEAEGVAFAQYWRGNGRRRADWNAQWAARVQARHAAVMRDAKAGVVFGSAAKALRAASAQIKVSEAAREREDETSARLQQVLRNLVGSEIAAQWFEPSAMIFDEGGLTVVCPGRFYADWIERNHKRTVQDGLYAIGRNVEFIRFIAEAAPPAGKVRRRG
jgi:hypothetical protein